eukprot:scaffold122950_cov31-Tisochrysis_lutea.AAC.3
MFNQRICAPSFDAVESPNPYRSSMCTAKVESPPTAAAPSAVVNMSASTSAAPPPASSVSPTKDVTARAAIGSRDLTAAIHKVDTRCGWHTSALDLGPPSVRVRCAKSA